MLAPTPIRKILTASGISRVSLLIQVDNYSLAAQAAKFKALGEKFSFVVPDEFLVEDAGFSGSDFSRPSIQQTLGWIREGKINAVVFPYLDRFARNLEGGLALVRKFREAGAEVLLGDYGWYNPNDIMLKMNMQLGLMIAEQQKDLMHAKSREGVAIKIEKGLAHGGKSPFGYHFVTKAELQHEAMQQGLPLPRKPENIHRPVPADIATYRILQDLALAGESARGICRELYDRGIKSPSGKARWNAATVIRLLNEPCYHTGIWSYGKHEGVAPKKIRNLSKERHAVKSSWKVRPESEWMGQKLIGGPITTTEKFEAVREALKRNGAQNVGKPARPEAEGGREALLRGMTKCSCCGRAVVPQSRTTPAGPRYWYRCSYRDRVTGESLCTAAQTVKADVLETLVWNGVEQALTVHLPTLVAAHQAEITEQAGVQGLAQMKEQEKKLVGKMQQAIDGSLDADDADEKARYAERAKEFKGQLLLLRRRIAAFTQEADAVQVDCPTIMRTVRVAMQTKDRGDRREILVAFIHEIVWNRLEQDAEITLRVPLAAAGVCNRQPGEPQVYNYTLLKTKVRAA